MRGHAPTRLIATAVVTFITPAATSRAAQRGKISESAITAGVAKQNAERTPDTPADVAAARESRERFMATYYGDTKDGNIKLTDFRKKDNANQKYPFAQAFAEFWRTSAGRGGHENGPPSLDRPFLLGIVETAGNLRSMPRDLVATCLEPNADGSKSDEDTVTPT